MARIRKLERRRVEQGTKIPTNGLKNVFAVNGFHVDLDDGHNAWSLAGYNPGPYAVRFTRCKPFANGQYVSEHDFNVPKGSANLVYTLGKLDNEDQFFFAEMQLPGGWTVLESVDQTSSGEVTNNGNNCDFAWWVTHTDGTLQKVRLILACNC